MSRPKITKKELERRKREKREFKREQKKIKKLRKKPKTSEFYRDIHDLQRIGAYSFKKAKNIIYYSPKYAKKRSEKYNKKLLHWDKVHQQLKKYDSEEAKKQRFIELLVEYEFYSG
ncbi:MAG: hypothetical protein SVW57_13240 [Thermodesulfobacteriota bacterium]|nr:hypothetical protein [Thermodesulfobacteriota bacterium]